jgi:hypothetical protein
MITEKGILPNGVEYNGERHKDFEIREQIVADSINVFDEPVRAAKAEKNTLYANLCVMANTLVSLGTIPKKDITPDLLMGMLQDDFNAINMAEVRLAVQRKSFRDKE